MAETDYGNGCNISRAELSINAGCRLYIEDSVIFSKKSLEIFFNSLQFTRIFKTLKVGLKYHFF